ncbi:hypothetical protein ACFLWA_00650 [Chloroflexota bacterium]
MSTEEAATPGIEASAQEYDLSGPRSTDKHYYLLQTEVATHSSKGVLKSTDIFRERLICEPGSPGEPDTFTCTRFSVLRDDSPEVTIPSLKGFSYEVNKSLLDKAGLDEQRQLYGIPEAQFEDLVDSTGEKLPFEVAYQVYSAFFYYHGYTDYAEPSVQGKGVQHLAKRGDKIVHDAAFAETVIPGSLAGKGSFWKNGEVTLEFKVLAEVDGKPCAVLRLDWGECTWAMPMTIMRLMRLKTKGVSTCRGDIYLDLESKWVRKLVMTLSENTVTTMWGIPVDRSKPETTLTIRAVSEEAFDGD